MAFEFSQVVAKLAETVGFLGKLKTFKNDLVNVPGSPAAEAVAAMQQNFEQPDDASLMDLDTGVNALSCLRGVNNREAPDLQKIAAQAQHTMKPNPEREIDNERHY